MRYINGKLDEDSLLCIEYKVECPNCGKEIESYGDFTCYCKGCKLGFHMDIYSIDIENLLKE